MEEMIFCQSCGMPLENEDAKGTNADGSKSEDYCDYCYKNGAFTQDMTMEEMITLNLKYLDVWKESTGENMSIEEARVQLHTFMPELKGWKK